MADPHGQMSMFWNLIFYLIRCIQLCDKKDLTFVDCCDKMLLNSLRKNVIKLAIGSLNGIFQDSFNKILFQQLTHDRSLCYMSFIRKFKVLLFPLFFQYVREALVRNCLLTGNALLA